MELPDGYLPITFLASANIQIIISNWYVPLSPKILVKDERAVAEGN